MNTAMLGPQGEQVAALIEQAGRLTAAEFRALADADYAARDTPWQVAKDARDAARAAGRPGVWDAVRNAVHDAAEAAGKGAVCDADRDGARNAAWRAAHGLLVCDLITSEQFDLMYGPWSSVIQAR